MGGKRPAGLPRRRLEKLWRREAQFRFARDSLLEQTGFELAVPLVKSGAVRDTTPGFARVIGRRQGHGPIAARASMQAEHSHVR
jgi:hypothetical protein